MVKAFSQSRSDPTYNNPTNSSRHVNKASNNIYTSASATPIDPSTQAISMVNGHRIGNTNLAADLALISASSTYNDSASQNHVKALGDQIGGGPNYPQGFTSYGAPGINHDQFGVEFMVGKVPVNRFLDWSEDMYYEELDKDRGPLRVFFASMAPGLVKRMN